jgi:DeoR/GlpR family transcriptional regulator of sugar metabolism
LKQTEERKQAILEILKKENRIYVSDLSQQFGVSEVTIRKDLQDLESKSLLQRLHGGATVMDKVAVEPCLDELQQINMEQKRAIAEIAYSYITDNDTILLDCSTTTRELAHLIRSGNRSNLTIITTALQIAQELASSDDIQVVQIGGNIRKSLYTAMGPLATAALLSLHADKAFIGVNGIDPAVGLTTQNMLECEIKRHIINASTQSFVLADASKMRKVALSVICPTSRVDYIITDDSISPNFANQLKDSGVEVVIAKV